MAERIYVCDAKAGESTVYKIGRDGVMTPIVSGYVLLGIALDGNGGAAVVSQTSIYRIKLPA